MKIFTLKIATILLSTIGLINTINAQSKISGKILDAKGEALAGASVAIKGTAKGTTTNSAGNFTIENLVNGTYNLKVSFLGYNARSITVAVPQIIELSVSLEEDAAALDEVEQLAARR